MTQTQTIRPRLWWAALAIPFSLAGLVFAVFFLVTAIQRVGSSMAYANVPGEMDVDLKRNLSYTVFLEQTLDGNSAATPMSALRSSVRCELHTFPDGDVIPMTALQAPLITTTATVPVSLFSISRFRATAPTCWRAGFTG